MKAIINRRSIPAVLGGNDNLSTRNKALLIALGALSLVLLVPSLAHADLESSLNGIKYQLTGVILPTLSVIGIGFAAVSFFTGNPDAKRHIFYAVLGVMIGFGAQAIVDFIAGTVH